MPKKRIHFVTLFSLVVFCLYIFINILFPYANIISTGFLSISTGLLLYSLFDNNETILTLSLISILISLALSLFQFLT